MSKHQRVYQAILNGSKTLREIMAKVDVSISHAELITRTLENQYLILVKRDRGCKPNIYLPAPPTVLDLMPAPRVEV